MHKTREQTMIEPKYLESFRLMWESFPAPVMLLHRNRMILATNQAARTAGVRIGSKCFELNPEEGKDHCKHCKAQQALKTRRAVVAKEMHEGQEVYAYWLPVQDSPDLFVHFGLRVEDMETEKPALEFVSVGA
jgi:hypothetical protein